MSSKRMMAYTCPFCGKESMIDISKNRDEMTVWERDCIMCGICETCYEKTYNVPTAAHKEEWGPIVRHCPNCDCRMYQKDIDKGHCPSCWMPCDEMDTFTDEDTIVPLDD